MKNEKSASPLIRMMGKKTTMVVKVDSVMARPISVVPFTALFWVSSPACRLA